MRLLLVVAVAALAAGCSMKPPKDSPRVAYRQAESTQSLIVPPDLTRQASASALEIEQATVGDEGEVLPEFADIRMVRAGPLQWLEVEDASPQTLWPRMAGFLRSEGLAIGNRQPAVGVIETVWSRRYDSVPQGGLSGLFSGILSGLGSDPIQDKYQIRLERTDDGSGTRIFLTHWAAQRINENPNTRDTPILATARIEPDPAIAAEMRRRLLVYLGVSRARATRIASLDGGAAVYTAPVRLVETEGGEAQAVIAEPDYRRGFGLVGEGLRVAGAEVIESSVERGRIWLRWLPPEAVRGSGLFSSDRPRELVLRLEPRDGRIRVVAGQFSGEIGREERYKETFSSGKIEVALLERLVNAMGGDVSGYRDVEDPEEVGPSRLDDPAYK